MKEAKIIHDKELNRQIVSMVSQTMKTIKKLYLYYYQTEKGESVAVKCLATLNTAAIELEKENKELI